MMRHQSRREMLTEILRYAALGLLGAVGWLVTVRRDRFVRQDSCDRVICCVGCQELEKCRLPRALSVKQTIMRVEDVEK
jgi:hypothetical protein